MPEVQHHNHPRTLREVAAYGLHCLKATDFLRLTCSPLPAELTLTEQFRLLLLRAICLRQNQQHSQAATELARLHSQLPAADPDDTFMYHCESARTSFHLGDVAGGLHSLLNAHACHAQASAELQDYLHLSNASMYATLDDDEQLLRHTRLAARTPPVTHPYHLAWNDHLRRATLACALGLTGYTCEALKLLSDALHGLEDQLPHHPARRHLIVLQLVFAAREGILKPDDPQFQAAHNRLKANPTHPDLIPLTLARAMTTRQYGQGQEARCALQKALHLARHLNDCGHLTLHLHDEALSFYREQGQQEQVIAVLESRIRTLETRRQRSENLLHLLSKQPRDFFQWRPQDTRRHAHLIERLAQVIERDEAEQHTRRVANLTYHVARHLNLPEAHEIAAAASLHDLGKVSVPDRILLKPGPLTPEERLEMQAHTEIGARLLNGGNSRIMKLARLIARHHHERWDGTGYPDRLSGETIPLAARITAVADVFDALTSERPYKTAWSCEAALTEIIAQSGRHFDPNVVDALTELLSHEQGMKLEVEPAPARSA